MENFRDAVGQFLVRTSEEETRRAVGFAFGAEAAEAEAETIGAVGADEAREEVSVARVARGLGGEAEFGANGIGQEGVLAHPRRQGAFAATGETENRSARPQGFEPTENFHGVFHGGGEEAKVFDLTLMQGLLPIGRKIAEQRRDGGIIESFDQSFQGGSGGWFVVFDILVERGEKFAA